jgi:hypothetical protein
MIVRHQATWRKPQAMISSTGKIDPALDVKFKPLSIENLFIPSKKVRKVSAVDEEVGKV